MMRNGIIARWNLVAVAAAFALAASGCLAGDTQEGSSELATKAAKPDPGAGGGWTGQCSDILTNGCDGTTGAKLEQCKKDIQNAFDACVKLERCYQLRDRAAKGCGKDIACLDKAEQIFNDCVGPAPEPAPIPGK